MDESTLAAEIAELIISDIGFWISVIGFLGVVVGALITVLGNVIIHWLQVRKQSEIDEKRIDMLKDMLDDDRFPGRWRKLSTMSAIIGADEVETKRLLILADARGSEKGDGKWGLIKNHPFPSKE